MPVLRGSEWAYSEGELKPWDMDAETKAENKPGHKPLASYHLPKWVHHPEMPRPQTIVQREDYYGMAADGLRNYENWNVAHVAAVHDDLKLLSLATMDQCVEPNKWGFQPVHMTAMGLHPYGPSLCVLYELVQMGAADPEAMTAYGEKPVDLCTKLHPIKNYRKYEKVLLKGWKPPEYDDKLKAQLKPHGKFARALGLLPEISDYKAAIEPDVGLCLVFPGQGSQYVGMMKDLVDIPAVTEYLTKSKDILGYDILEYCLDGPEETLSLTKYCQPAMYIAGLAAFEKLKMQDPDKAESFKAVAGLSLGEYCALTVAGVFDFETGLNLVKIRAEAMHNETAKAGAPAQAMLSIAGLDKAIVERLCNESKGPGETCQISNFLFKDGFSVGGNQEPVEKLEEKAKQAGALQAKLLKTSGAFHTPMMQGARDALMEALNNASSKMSSPNCDVYMNVTSNKIGPDTPVSEICEMLGNQLTSAVLWDQSMREAISDGISEFIELGPSKQLKAMMKRIDGKVSESMTNITA